MDLLSTILSLFILQIAVMHDSMATETLAEYFPDIKNDLTKVTWEHAVNSKEKLMEALKGDALMLEADVVLGYTSEEARDRNDAMVPIMAHPPDIISNLTLEEFIQEFDKSETQKGMKLDFKTRRAFAHSEGTLDKLFSSYHTNYPVWLNADIFPGPVNATTDVVDPDYFLSICIARYPYATLSVGWSTRLDKGSTEGTYTDTEIDGMGEVLNKNMVLTMPVTFAVRAAIAARSVDILTSLINSSTNEATTLTIWSSDPNDVVDIHGIKKLIDQVGKDKVYLDLPKELMDKLENEPAHALSSTLVPASSLIAIVSIILSLFL